jgi:hypothetical protein
VSLELFARHRGLLSVADTCNDKFNYMLYPAACLNVPAARAGTVVNQHVIFVLSVLRTLPSAARAGLLPLGAET